MGETMAARKMYIDGQWIESGKSISTINPATGEDLALVSSAGANELAQALQAAKDASHDWAATDITRRADIIKTFAESLEEAYGDEGEETALKRLIRDEVGKRIPEADLEVAESAEIARFFSDNAPRWLANETLALNQDLWPTKRSEVRYMPHGVVAVIKPWNYPLELAIWAIVPALISGNTVIFKPSQLSPLVGLEIAKMLDDAGIPPGVFNVITGDDQLGKELVRSREIAYVSFTGSVAAGKDVAAVAAQRLIPTGLELGGIDAAIVCDDVDVDMAARGLVWGSFANAGQVCVKPKRVLVHAAVYDRVLSRVVELTSDLKQGRDFGPVISDDAAQRIQRQIEDTANTGESHIVLGGKRITGDGYFIEPTIIADIGSDSPMWKEECFGPVLAIRRVDSIDEAIALANLSDYGLAASIWGSSKDRMSEIADQLEVGTVWINDVNLAFPSAPWGGVKLSGIGKDLGRWGLEEYVVAKHVNIEQSDERNRDWWFPYDA
jgi:acyl-CoA reductase-like NAD-dependent aldehyde dehydrogenase